MLAFSRKQIRHRPNLRYTDRGRPQNLQRFSLRVLNLGVRFAFATFDLLAISCRQGLSSFAWRISKEFEINSEITLLLYFSFWVE